MQHPVDLTQLPEGARKVLGGPAPLKMMAARGMAPLPPVAMMCALYGLAWSDEPGLRDAAAKTLLGLPEAVVGSALAAPDFPAAVLDDFVTRAAGNRAYVERVVRHPNASGETIARLARAGDEALSEIIAQNEQRLLTSPEVIEALYMNPATRMSTSDRIVEFAARNGLKVNIPGFEQIAAALKQQVIPPPSVEPAERDTAFVQAMVESEQFSLDDIEEDEDGSVRVKEGARKAEKKLEDMNVTEKIRTAMLGTALQRSLLVRSTNRLVAAAVLDSPKIGDDEVIKIAGSRAVSDDILRRISSRGAWLRLYEVKFNLVSNPKTPVGESMKLIVHLRESDMKRVAASKNVAGAVRAAAMNHLKKRK
ncbi:MAG: hypothetical protein JWM10_4368 [Myxococcaceae bacterium]|nr:hypothetical protein [Myxococcaceae bacterium]